MPGLTHLDDQGRARMVDVSAKDETVRQATARGRLIMAPDTRRAALEGSGPKGEVRAVAELAGVMAAKRTADLIPLCHPLALSGVRVTVEPDGDDALMATATVRCTARTGVEMEALTACTVTLLTLYDMLKAIDRSMTLGDIAVVQKSGGSSGDWTVA